MTEVEVVVDGRALVVEGPVWDAARQTLIWVDILRREVHRYTPETGSDSLARLPVTIGAARPRVGGGLVVAAGLGVAGYDEQSGELNWLGCVDIGDRMNDATCDPLGRLWAGTLSIGRPGAALYRMDRSGSFTCVLDDVGLSKRAGLEPGQLECLLRGHVRRTGVRVRRRRGSRLARSTASVRRPA